MKSLNVPLGEKGTNDNYDAWFIGFSSDLVIGVYVDLNPQKHWKIRDGFKTLPIFKSLENALFEEDFKDFNIPENIYLTSLNYDTGLKSLTVKKT